MGCCCSKDDTKSKPNNNNDDLTHPHEPLQDTTPTNDFGDATSHVSGSDDAALLTPPSSTGGIQQRRSATPAGAANNNNNNNNDSNNSEQFGTNVSLTDTNHNNTNNSLKMHGANTISGRSDLFPEGQDERLRMRPGAAKYADLMPSESDDIGTTPTAKMGDTNRTDRFLYDDDVDDEDSVDFGSSDFQSPMEADFTSSFASSSLSNAFMPKGYAYYNPGLVVHNGEVHQVNNNFITTKNNNTSSPQGAKFERRASKNSAITVTTVRNNNKMQLNGTGSNGRPAMFARSMSTTSEMSFAPSEAFHSCRSTAFSSDMTPQRPPTVPRGNNGSPLPSTLHGTPSYYQSFYSCRSNVDTLDSSRNHTNSNKYAHPPPRQQLVLPARVATTDSLRGSGVPIAPGKSPLTLSGDGALHGVTPVSMSLNATPRPAESVMSSCRFQSFPPTPSEAWSEVLPAAQQGALQDSSAVINGQYQNDSFASSSVSRPGASSRPSNHSSSGNVRPSAATPSPLTRSGGKHNNASVSINSSSKKKTVEKNTKPKRKGTTASSSSSSVTAGTRIDGRARMLALDATPSDSKKFTSREVSSTRLATPPQNARGVSAADMQHRNIDRNNNNNNKSGSEQVTPQKRFFDAIAEYSNTDSNNNNNNNKNKNGNDDTYAELEMSSSSSSSSNRQQQHSIASSPSTTPSGSRPKKNVVDSGHLSVGSSSGTASSQSLFSN